MVRGEGIRTWDVDGNEYRDFLGNYTSLFLGLLADGFDLAPRGMGSIATPATDADIDDLIGAVVGRLRSMPVVRAA